MVKIGKTFEHIHSNNVQKKLDLIFVKHFFVLQFLVVT